MILTYEQVDAMTYEECTKALKQLFKEHRMETPWHEMTKEEWEESDDVGNTMLWLEDRIKKFEDPRIASMDPGMAIVPVRPEPKLKSGPRARRYRIGEVIYDDIHQAALKTGVKVNTLRNYVGRKPDIYAYLD